jgi:hypothetical protein
MNLSLLDKALYRYPMFAEGNTGGGGSFVDTSDDDDPNEDDLEGVVMVDDDDDTESEPTEETEPVVPPAKSNLPATQEDLDELIEGRLARQSKQFEKEIERIRADQQQLTQTELNKQQFAEWDKYTQQMFNQSYQSLTNAGYDDALAKAFAHESVKNEITRLQLQQEQEARRKQEERVSGMIMYSQQKSSYISKNPLVAKYVEEIDEIAQNGEKVDFETAANYVLGKKVISGEIQDIVKAVTEQKTLKNIDSRKRIAVESAGLPGKDDSVSLTREQRKMARALGISEKEYSSHMPKRKK